MRDRIAATRQFFKMLWALARPYWFAQDRQTIGRWGFSITLKEAWIARGLLLSILVLGLLSVYMAKLFNDWNALFYNALQEKNAPVFWYELGYWTVLAAIFITLAVYRIYLSQLLTIRWRRWLSQVYFRDWLADRTYYRMEVVGQGADNPEQRIEQDCQLFATQTLNLTVNLLLQVMTLATFATILW